MSGPKPKRKINQRSSQISPELRWMDRRLREIAGLVQHFQSGGMTRQAACAQAYLETIRRERDRANPSTGQSSE